MLSRRKDFYRLLQFPWELEVASFLWFSFKIFVLKLSQLIVFLLFFLLLFFVDLPETVVNDLVCYRMVYLFNGNFFQTAFVSILLYGCTTWTLIKRREKKIDGNYSRMLRALLNKFWRQHPTRHQLYGYLPPITKTIQVRRTSHVGHCWKSTDELTRDVLLWTPTYGRAKPARTYIQQLCEDTGCGPEDLLEAMNDREKWRERVRDIWASGTTWWWWWCLTAYQHLISSLMPDLTNNLYTVIWFKYSYLI